MEASNVAALCQQWDEYCIECIILVCISVDAIDGESSWIVSSAAKLCLFWVSNLKKRMTFRVETQYIYSM